MVTVMDTRNCLALLILAAICANTDAQTTVYKCRGSGGIPVYQQLPCAANAQLRDFQDDPATVSVVPFDVPMSGPPAKMSRGERAAQGKAPAKPDRRKLEAERRTNDAAVAERRHVKDGMSDGEVLARLGPPDLQSGKSSRKTRWTYLPAPADPQTMTLVRFEDGKVVGVERTIMR